MFLVFRRFEESLEHHSNIGFFSALCSPHKPQLATCNPKKPAPSLNRHLLQLHHVYGRIVGGVDSSGAQLSPSHSGHPREATVGELIISKHFHCSLFYFCPSVARLNPFSYNGCPGSCGWVDQAARSHAKQYY